MANPPYGIFGEEGKESSKYPPPRAGRRYYRPDPLFGKIPKLACPGDLLRLAVLELETSRAFY